MNDISQGETFEGLAYRFKLMVEHRDALAEERVRLAKENKIMREALELAETYLEGNDIALKDIRELLGPDHMENA